MYPLSRCTLTARRGVVVNLGHGRHLSALVRAVKKRTILVFAHVPPPHHGQSVIVQVLLDGLRSDPRVEVHHVAGQDRREGRLGVCCVA